MSGFGPNKCPVCGYEWMGTLGSPKLSALASTKEWEERIIAMCPMRHTHKEVINGVTEKLQRD